MLMILARLVRSESFWAVAKVRSPHTGPEVWYPRKCQQTQRVHLRQQQLRPAPRGRRSPPLGCVRRCSPRCQSKEFKQNNSQRIQKVDASMSPMRRSALAFRR